jgi:hypothetical protein
MKSWRLMLVAIAFFGLLSVTANNIFPDEAYAAWARLARQERQDTAGSDPIGVMHRPPIFPGSRSIVLPATQAAAITHLCSRVGPKVEGTWDATEADIDALETNLQEVSDLRSTWGSRSLRIVDPRSFYRQYIAIVVAARRLICVNAFYDIDSLPSSAEQLVSVCDGGPYFWGAVFDPATRKYSDLNINGRG